MKSAKRIIGQEFHFKKTKSYYPKSKIVRMKPIGEDGTI
jgi:hypothetical protein